VLLIFVPLVFWKLCGGAPQVRTALVVVAGESKRSSGLPAPRPGEVSTLSAEQVALIPQCAECREVWLPADEDRWKAYLDTDDVLVFFCPECAKREFGQRRS
jgi:hypothetical protein